MAGARQLIEFGVMVGETTRLAFLVPNIPKSYTRLDKDEVDLWLEPRVKTDAYYTSSARGTVNGYRVNDIGRLPVPPKSPLYFEAKDGVHIWEDGGEYNLELVMPDTSVSPGEYEVVIMRRREGEVDRYRYPSEEGGMVLLSVEPGNVQ